mmetsp:Transcript_11807/g.24916  ORF Transcript_11807/g.24916 Transcript_11807/m.24916 type:complete len:403 (-) Transcript_11807:221-1429(-)
MIRTCMLSQFLPHSYSSCTMCRMLQSFLLVLVAGTSISAADELSDGVIEWVQSKPGGYYNADKLEIRRGDPNDETSPLGVFAKADIEPNETLMRIPTECYIHVWDEAKNMNLDDMEGATEAYNHNMCLLAQKTKREMQLQDKSEFAPYVRYLNNQRRGQLPATWSDYGKELLQDLLPPGSDGVNWMQKFKGKCISSTDTFEEQVLAVTKQRAFDDAMIPLWDMVNHDNGRINTENTSMYEKDGLRVWASRAIQAGEEIYMSYDKCKDCMDVDEYWGTPEILRDFGFVEPHPHRFVYTDQEIWFEVWESENGGEKEVRWDDYKIDGSDDPNDYNSSPDRPGIDFMRNELKRVNEMPPYEGTCPPNVPSHECAIIVQYKRAVTEALPLAIDSAESWLTDVQEEL